MARLWIAACLAAVALVFAAWIYLPAPTYTFLYLSVGAPEICQWIAVVALLGLGLAVPDARHSTIARGASAGAAVALALAMPPLVRAGAVGRGFASAMREMSVEPPDPARTLVVSTFDLFRGIDPGAPKITRGIVFAQPGGAPLRLDVYQPPRAGKFPILIQIYGGAWQRGAPGDNAQFASLMASHGWIVFAIDYRHAPAFRWPAQLDDVDSALVWIRDHAGTYGGDVSRVVLMGRSAGGHLAMMAAYKNPPIDVRGVVSYYGPADLADAYNHPPRPDPLDIRDVDVKFIGGTPDARPAEYADASPVSYTNRPQPPTLLINGARDNIVEARYARALKDRLRSGGTPVAYLEIPWAGHGFDAVFSGVSSQLALYYTERFVAWAAR